MDYFDKNYIENIKKTKSVNAFIEAIDNSNYLGNTKSIVLDSLLKKFKQIPNIVFNEIQSKQVFERLKYKFFSHNEASSTGYNNIVENYTVFYNNYRERNDNIKWLFSESNMDELDIIFDRERMYKNYKKLSKQLSIDENKASRLTNIEEIKDVVFEMCYECDRIYRPTLPKENLFRIVLESHSLLFKNNPNIEDILEAVLDYYILDESDSLLLEKEIINSKIISKDKAKNRILHINKEENKDKKPFFELNKFKTKDIIADIYKAFNNYKKSSKGKDDERKLKKVIDKLYKVPKDNIIEEYPFILGFVRRVVLIGTPALINPLLSIPVFIVDNHIHYRVNTENAKKLLYQLEKDIAKLEKKKNSYKNNKKIEEYIEKNKEAKEKIDQYLYNLKGDKEKDIEYEEESNDLNEIYIDLYIDEYISEGAFTNKFKDTITRARERIQKSSETISAKDKILSKQLDDTLYRLQYDMERSVAIKERERVIEGKLLPSASKCIKIAIGLGVGWAISPALTAFAAVAGMVMSKKANARERQLVLDDIEINLKIIERKIQQAESDGDDKKLEQLLRAQNTLQRERHRIKYRMKVYYNQRPNPSIMKGDRD